MRQCRIVATVHVATSTGYRVDRVVLERPPVATVSDVESIMGLWWFRAGGYPVGKEFGTAVGGLPIDHARR